MRGLIATIIVVCAIGGVATACPVVMEFEQGNENPVIPGDTWISRGAWIVLPARPSVYYLPHAGNDRSPHIEADREGRPVPFDLVPIGDAIRIDLHVDKGFVRLRTILHPSTGAAHTLENHYWVAPGDRSAPRLPAGLLEVGDDPAVFLIERTDGSHITVTDIDLQLAGEGIQPDIMRVTGLHTDGSAAVLWERHSRSSTRHWLALALLFALSLAAASKLSSVPPDSIG